MEEIRDIRMQILITKSMKAKIDRVSKEKNYSRNELINKALMVYLNRFKVD